jgi:hypothetical protein
MRNKQKPIEEVSQLKAEGKLASNRLELLGAVQVQRNLLSHVARARLKLNFFGYSFTASLVLAQPDPLKAAAAESLGPRV